jgi:hypothetical protein
MRLIEQSGFIFTGSIFQQQTSVPTCQITHSHNLEDYNFKVPVIFSAFPNKGVGVVVGMAYNTMQLSKTALVMLPHTAKPMLFYLVA